MKKIISAFHFDVDQLFILKKVKRTNKVIMLQSTLAAA